MISICHIFYLPSNKILGSFCFWWDLCPHPRLFETPCFTWQHQQVILNIPPAHSVSRGGAAHCTSRTSHIVFVSDGFDVDLFNVFNAALQTPFALLICQFDWHPQ